MHARTSLSLHAIALLAAALLLPARADALSARLAWSPVGGASGYKVYARASGGAYGSGMDVGALLVGVDGAVHVTIGNVAVGTVVAVSSYDAGGAESVRSNELAVPALPPIRTATPVRSATPTRMATPVRTATPAPTATPVRTATAVATGLASATPQPVPTPGPGDVASLADLTMLGSIIARVPFPTGGGNRDLEVIRDGDRPPPGNAQSSRQYDTFDGNNTASEDWIGYAFAAPQRFRRVVFQEGRHFWNGGWFETLTVEVRQNGRWLPVDAPRIAPPYPGVNALSYETFVMEFSPIAGDAIRIYGKPGGQDAFISVGELRVLGDGTGATPVAGSVLRDVTAGGRIVARVPAPAGGGNHDLGVIRDGDMPPVGNAQSSRQYDTYDGANGASEDWIGYTYPAPQQFRQVLFQEGRHFWDGGWFETLTVQVLRNGVWAAVDGLTVTPPYPGVNARSYETFVLSFAPMSGDGVRIYGRPGGSAAFISVGELRAYAEAPLVAMSAPTPAFVAGTASPAASGAAESAVPVLAPGTPAAAPTLAPTPVPAPVSACGDGHRGGREVCDGTDDASCPGRCRADCTCGMVVELPLAGWTALGGDVAGTLVHDDVAAATVLAVTAPAPADTIAPAALAYPAAPTLVLALPQLALTARALVPFELDVIVRAASGTTYELAYRAADGSAASVLGAGGTRAIFAIGGLMASGQVGTTYRDLAADLRAAFGVPFASVAGVRVQGSADLFRVALASDRGRDEDTAALLTFPLAGWDRRGNGTVTENAWDPMLAGLAMHAVPSTHPTSRLQLTYPPADAPRLLPLRTLAFALADAEGFAVEVQAVTAAGNRVQLTYELGRTDAQLQLRRGIFPLATVPRPGGAYADVRLDLAGDVAALDPAATLAGVTSVRLRGGFSVGGVQLRDPIGAPTP